MSMARVLRKHLIVLVLAAIGSLGAVPSLFAQQAQKPAAKPAPQASIRSAQKPLPDPLAPGVTGSARLEALLERVKAEQASRKTMEARFVQKQESALLAAPEESRGVFSYRAPDSVRWEYTSPNPISIVIQGDHMTTWYRDLNRAEKLKIGRYSNQFFKYLGASGNLDTLREYFDVKLQVPAKKGDPFRMELMPRYARISRRVKTMVVWIDSERYLPVRIRYVAADGDSTEYEFQDLKINAAIPQDRFVLKIPKGVETKVIDLSGEGGAAGNVGGRGAAPQAKRQ
jgi:outer membrane lipoprotein-sorting protein